MQFSKTIPFTAVIAGTVILNAQCAIAGFMDVDARAGAQTVSWAEPSTIMIFIPNALAGVDRMNFEMGINAVADCLPMITVQFKNGEPPQNAQNYVDVGVMNLNPPPYGEGGAFVPNPYPANQNHVNVNSGAINIDVTSLGHSAVAPTFMKNLGAHEFGHVLGLDEDPRQGGQRMNVMDPDFGLIFDPENDVTGADPFVGLSARDKMMLREHYTVAPEPTSIAVCMVGAVCLLGRHRRLGTKPWLVMNV